MKTFSAKVQIIGVNPYVLLPDAVLKAVFKQAGKERAPIPVRGKLNGKVFKQTLVKYRGAWRLYLNGAMREAAHLEVGDMAKVALEFDPVPRIEPMNVLFEKALFKRKQAQQAFERLAPSHRGQILRYLNGLKSEEALARNVDKVIQHLLGEFPVGLYALMRRQEPKKGS